MDSKEVFTMAIRFMQRVFCIMLAMCVIIGGLFGYYIHKSFQGADPTNLITTLENDNGKNNKNSIKVVK